MLVAILIPLMCSSFDTAARELPIRSIFSTHLMSLWRTQACALKSQAVPLVVYIYWVQF